MPTASSTPPKNFVPFMCASLRSLSRSCRSLGFGGSGARRRAGHGNRAGPAEHAAVDRVAGPADRLEIQVVSADLHDHEMVVEVEALGGHLCRADVALAQRAAGA